MPRDARRLALRASRGTQDGARLMDATQRQPPRSEAPVGLHASAAEAPVGRHEASAAAAAVVHHLAAAVSPAAEAAAGKLLAQEHAAEQAAETGRADRASSVATAHGVPSAAHAHGGVAAAVASAHGVPAAHWSAEVLPLLAAELAQRAAEAQEQEQGEEHAKQPRGLGVVAGEARADVVPDGARRLRDRALEVRGAAVREGAAVHLRRGGAGGRGAAQALTLALPGQLARSRLAAALAGARGLEPPPQRRLLRAVGGGQAAERARGGALGRLEAAIRRQELGRGERAQAGKEAREVAHGAARTVGRLGGSRTLEARGTRGAGAQMA
mmetsp:Transcript_98448/g.256508  ORF Transcript_98448/g.256508 Transcript_98448/m.256508 type:complete len:327 (-) Transcript_98448:3-983(-)